MYHRDIAPNAKPVYGERVIRVLTRRGRNATVEVVADATGELAVCKTFLPGKEEFCERELHSLKALHKICPDVVPPLLAQGDNYVVIPFYSDARSSLAKLFGLPLPLNGLRKAFAAAQTFLDNGFVLADFRPHNLLFERGGSIKIIDYENVYACRDQGGNSSDGGPLPFDEALYRLHWIRVSGVSLQSLLHDPLWLAQVKRWSIGPFIMAYAALAKVFRHRMNSFRRSRMPGPRDNELPSRSHAGSSPRSRKTGTR